MIYDVSKKVEKSTFLSSLRIRNHPIPFWPTLPCNTTDIHKWTSKNHPLPARKTIFWNFPHKLWQWDQCTYSLTFLSDKAHNIYKYLKCIKLTGKREYVRREMKRVSHLCVSITELRIKQFQAGSVTGKAKKCKKFLHTERKRFACGGPQGLRIPPFSPKINLCIR